MKTIILITSLLITSGSVFSQQQMRGSRGNTFNYIQTNKINERNVQTINQTANNSRNLNFDNVTTNVVFSNGNLRGNRGGGPNTGNYGGNRGSNPIQVNTDRNVAQQIVNDNSFIQSVQIVELQSRGNRGNVSRDNQNDGNVGNPSRGSRGNSDRGSRGNNFDLAINTQSTNKVKTQNVKQKSRLSKIELPSPRSVEVSKKETSSAPKVPINLSGIGKSEKKKKASQGWGRNPNNKHFMKKKVWRPMRKWFKRHFKRTKKTKVKLTCFFKS